MNKSKIGNEFINIIEDLDSDFIQTVHEANLIAENIIILIPGRINKDSVA